MILLAIIGIENQLQDGSSLQSLRAIDRAFLSFGKDGIAREQVHKLEVNRARALAQLGKFKESEEILLDQLLGAKEFANLPSVLITLGKINVQVLKYNEAQKYLEEALTYDQQNHQALALLG